MTNPRSKRQFAIVQLLRARGWVSSVSLAERFAVSPRTIYRDIEQLISHGVMIEATAGRTGGFRLARETPTESLTVDSQDALQLYALSLIRQEPADGLESPDAAAVGQHARRVMARLSQRIYFDTTEWYWRDDSSGHLATLRDAVITALAVEITLREKGRAPYRTVIVKPYGLVWKAGDWWLVAAKPNSEVQRFKLNNIDRVTKTDLQFRYPDDFDLAAWWKQALEDYGRGTTRVVLLVQPDSREEMLRLNLKPDSEVRDGDDGVLFLTLYVDRWRWLIPLLATFGSQVEALEPTELVQAIRNHHEAALRMYHTAPPQRASNATPFRNDDSRLRATRGRTADEPDSP
jgi:predicted DNA-binding transcriptional regulator YafY